MVSLETFGTGSTATYITVFNVLKFAVLYLIYCQFCLCSILGPLLFLIYISDLSTVTQFCNLFLFADAAKLTKTIVHLSDHSHLQQDLDQLHTWSLDSDLLFSINKCILLSFNNKIPTSYSVGSDTLPQLHFHRDLGILLSNDLTWSNHYNHIISKAYKYLGLLRRIFGNCQSIEAKKFSTYVTLVRSQLTYCSQLSSKILLS